MFDTDLHEFCRAAGLPVLSAHKLRHAHGVYGVRHAKTVEELKSVSQNMMHANVGITDGLYGELPEGNVKQVIATFGNTPTIPPENTQKLPPKLIQLARLLLAQMNK